MNLDEAPGPMERILAQAVEWVPEAASVLLVLAVGLVLSAAAGRAARWMIKRSRLEALAERLGVARLLYAAGIKDGVARLLGRLVWFAGLLVTFSAVTELLGLPGVAELAAAVVGVLPRIVVAAGVAAAGLALADVLRTAVRRAGRRERELESAELPAQLAYYAVLTISLTIALEQAGLKTGLVTALVQIFAGICALSVGLAFALGSRWAFRNLVSRHYAERLLRPGDRIRVGDRCGRVARFGPITLVLETDDGHLLIPCARLVESEIHLEARADEASKRSGKGGPPPQRQG